MVLAVAEAEVLLLLMDKILLDILIMEILVVEMVL